MSNVNHVPYLQLWELEDRNTRMIHLRNDRVPSHWGSNVKSLYSQVVCERLHVLCSRTLYKAVPFIRTRQPAKECAVGVPDTPPVPFQI